MDGMMVPRLMTSPSARAATEYQLIRAKETPASFNAIHVPPFGSEG
jgi:hypothetical protein